MRRVLAAAVLALLAQVPRAHAVPPVVTWCVSSPGAADLCSPDEDRVVAAVRKRLAQGEGWWIGDRLTVERVQ